MTKVVSLQKPTSKEDNDESISFKCRDEFTRRFLLPPTNSPPLERIKVEYFVVWLYTSLGGRAGAKEWPIGNDGEGKGREMKVVRL